MHVTSLLLLPLIASALGGDYLGQMAQAVGRSATDLEFTALVSGSLITVGLFVSLFLHEVGHLVAAQRYGVQVKAITILVLGGMTQLDPKTPMTPTVAAKIAAAGPAVNLIIALLCILFLWGTDLVLDLQLSISLIGVANLFVGLFNLIPAFPLDGGRILEAILSRFTNRARAVEMTCSSSKMFSLLLFVLGAAQGSIIMMLFSGFVYLGARARALVFQDEGEKTTGKNESEDRTLFPIIIAHTLSLTIDLKQKLSQMPNALVWVHTQSGTPIGLTDGERLRAWSEETVHQMALDSFAKVYFGEPVSAANTRHKDWLVLYDEYNVLRGAIKNQ